MSNKNQKLEAALAALPELEKAVGEHAAAREASRELGVRGFHAVSPVRLEHLALSA